jgi:Rod binding domain-containing protein
MGSIAAVTTAAGSSQGAVQPRLARAAHEFEAQMLKELLQPVTRSSGLLGDEDESGAGGVLAQFGSEALAGALSAQGGFGIANRIVHDLSHSSNRSATTPVMGNSQIDTAMRRGK